MPHIDLISFGLGVVAGIVVIVGGFFLFTVALAKGGL